MDRRSDRLFFLCFNLTLVPVAIVLPMPVAIVEVVNVVPMLFGLCPHSGPWTWDSWSLWVWCWSMGLVSLSNQTSLEPTRAPPMAETSLGQPPHPPAPASSRFPSRRTRYPNGLFRLGESLFTTRRKNGCDPAGIREHGPLLAVRLNRQRISFFRPLAVLLSH
jgi:hypothetical protein